MKSSVVMVILCRDESDIIRESLAYHLHHGVEAFVVMDNDSTDGTRDILAEFEKLGVATIVEQPMHTKAQGKWMTELARLALDKYQPDWVLASDADEFWVSEEGNIATTLSQNSGGPDVGWHTVERFNMLLSRKQLKDPTGKFWQTSICVEKAFPFPMEYMGVDKPSPPENLLAYALGDKVICRPRGLKLMHHGNHVVEHDKPCGGRIAGMHVLHFPVRNYEQFIKKVSRNGSSYAVNKELSEDISWHLRRWYKLYQEGHLEEEFQKLVLTSEQERRYFEQGAITINSELWQAADRQEMNLSQEERRRLAQKYRWQIEITEPSDLQFRILEGQEYPAIPGTKRDLEYVIDIGANIGAASIHFSENYPNAEIHAFEPSPRNYAVLARNVGSRPQIKIYPFGIWSKDETREMRIAGTPVCDSLLISRHTTGEKVTVSLKRASDVIERITNGQPYILKVDTEGCEVEIFKELGSHLLLAEVIYFEYHSERDRLLIQQLLSSNHSLFYCSAVAPHRGICGYVLNRIMDGKPELSNSYRWE
jgi:FkbM family methyltransferase